MVPLARRNLFSEKGRFAMSVGGVAFAVLMILIVLALYRGWSNVGSVYTRLPGDVWISQTGTSDPYHSTSFLSAARGNALSRIDGVKAALPVYARHIAFRRHGDELDVFALALGAAPAIRFPAQDREFFPPPGEVNIDRVLAGQAGVRVGDRLHVLGHDLVVWRIHTGGNSIFQTAYLNAADARAMFGLHGLVNFFLLSLRPGADLASVEEAAVGAVPRSEAHTSEEFAASFGNRINQGFLAAVGVLVGIGFIVGGAVIALTTYTATIERAREFGVLKAVGASGGFLYRVVVTQSLIVGCLGAALGVAASALAADLIRRQVPEFLTTLRWTDALGVFAVALAVAVAASWVPVRRINLIDPAIVFRP
ncbi:MAG: ABC transporter permease [Gaiellaceae bacterium]